MSKKGGHKKVSKRYVLTTAQAHSAANPKFMDAMERYCSQTGAHPIILPTIGRYAKESALHKIFNGYDVEYADRRLNNKIGIQNFHVRPQQIDPTTGLGRFAQKDTTKIFASPKQRLKCIPNSNFKLPKILATTGACTYPRYSSGHDSHAERRRLGTIAKGDHTYGFVVVEVVDSNHYHMRHVRSTKSGRFVDLGTIYTPDEKPQDATLEALVCGDWHCGETDPAVIKATEQMIDIYEPKMLILHDFFNGHSVNPHNWGRLGTTVSEVYNHNRESLEAELDHCLENLHRFREWMVDKPIYIVACNHHDFLSRWLDATKFADDPINASIGAKIFSAYVNGVDPVKAGMELRGTLPKNVIFLDREEDLKKYGYQLASHGDYGVGGRKSASIKEKEFSHGKSITGHTHVPEIMRDTYVVGTSTPLRLPWMKGASAWMQTHGFLYSTGTVQLVNILNGEWTL